MALEKTLSSLLLLLLTLLGLGLVQPSYGETMYQQFLRQHVDSNGTPVSNSYCNNMMQTRNMTRPLCKQFNTFIHEQKTTIINICNNPKMWCKNGWHICHAGVVRVTECSLISRVPSCRYHTTTFTAKQVVIACKGNPLRPVHFDR